MAKSKKEKPKKALPIKRKSPAPKAPVIAIIPEDTDEDTPGITGEDDLAVLDEMYKSEQQGAMAD